MKAKLVVEGREFDIEINDPELQKLVKPEKKTGYERVSRARAYFSTYPSGKVNAFTCTDSTFDDEVYSAADYYSDRTVAENNARADKLMRQLRRFAVEYRKDSLCWIKGVVMPKWSIVYDCSNDRIIPSKHFDAREAFAVHFDSEETAKLAIKMYHDELIWYFTEYKDSL